MANAYYNEIDPFAAAWLRNLIDAGLIAPGDVDERSIEDVTADELSRYTQCHFFAGIGVWSHALRLAGWGDDRPCWTGSCPCQPYSAAGKQKGDADPRNLWPAFFRLIRECRPSVVFGEQVSSAIRHGWLDGVCRDLEAEGYACGAAVLGAHSVGAPHIRQRLYWCARMEHAADSRCTEAGQPGQSIGRWRVFGSGCGTDRLGDGLGPRLEGRQSEPSNDGPQQSAAKRTSGAWADCSVVHCRDGKARRISAQSGDEPLAYGIARKLGQEFAGVAGLAKDARRNRVGRLRGYGNAIVAQQAAAFIEAYLDVTDGWLER